MNENAFCNNCGKAGHPFHQCKLPITSIGIIAFRFPPNSTINSKKDLEFLMIRRKDTLGYMDFMRGKFPIYQKNYILNMMTQMTIEEKTRLRQKYHDFHNHEMVGTHSQGTVLKEKIHALIVGINHPDGSFYDLAALLDESDTISEQWHEPEWGFPKGRRNVQENDYDCALREFSEETGYATTVLQNIRNILPFEEIFIGSNYKSYRHKYYIMHIDYEASVSNQKPYQKSEVSGMEWKSYDQCISDIRSYNLEKKRILRNVYECIAANKMVSIPISNGSSLVDI
jgi:8-oxo-dGTP pyrophosphatase MutT (NUDIX family)